ncbi:MAG: GNAT family N-acetyltransferase [Lachnospiraceae bacterium]|nr:GNAT family N-acetyltransferase [Lachnospiraceae bacterium]
MEFITLNRKSFPQYLKEFADLYTLCFGVEMNDAEVRWRYLESPYEGLFSCIAVDRGRLIANYSASPIALSYHGEPLKAALSLNTMTHPDYIGKGLFVKLASSVYQHLYETGHQMILGFPNNISNRTFVTKLGWKDICEIPTLQLDVKNVKKRKTAVDFDIIEDNNFLLEYNGLATRDEIAVLKPVEYLRWRFEKHPANRYYNFAICEKKNGAVSSRIIIKEFRDRINIVDSSFRNEEELYLLINRVIEFALEKEKTFVTMWSKLGSWEHIALEGYGAVLTSPVTYFGANVFGDNVDKEDIYNANAWRLSMSDDNVY